MIVDTHTHLYLPEFEPDFTAAVDRAVSAGVKLMVFPNVDRKTIGPMRELNSLRPDNTLLAMGLHPTEINSDWESDLRFIEDEFRKHRSDYIAIGEIGIDLYWDQSFRKEQMDAFERQCRIAVSENLPVIVHCRDGLNETLEVLDSMGNKPNGVFHSFGGTVEDVDAIRRRGDFYFGINGIVTFKNSRLRDVLPEIGLERIVLETDSPYLAPVPHRGKRNESSFIIHVAEYIALVFNTSRKMVEDITTSNAKQLFSL